MESYPIFAWMAELVDAADSKSAGFYGLVGSSPTPGKYQNNLFLLNKITFIFLDRHYVATLKFFIKCLLCYIKKFAP